MAGPAGQPDPGSDADLESCLRLAVTMNMEKRIDPF